MPRDAVIARLLYALDAGDEPALSNLLDRYARMVVDTNDDSGGVLTGRQPCVTRLKDLRRSAPESSFVAVQVNGQPGVALRSRDGFDSAVLCVEYSHDGLITSVWLSAAPLKLAFWNRQQRAPRRISPQRVTEAPAVWSELEQDAEPPSPLD